MSKSPAFQFYPLDFMGDINVKLMPLHVRGAYMMLLCHEWIEGGLPDDDNALSILSELGVQWEEHKEKILKCFQKKRGFFVHPRLEFERKKQKENRDRKKEAGKTGAKVRWGRENQEIAGAIVLPCDCHDSANAIAIAKDSSSSSSSTSVKEHSNQEEDYSQIPPTVISEIEELCREATGGFFPQCLDAAIERGNDAILGALDQACQLRKDKGKPVGWGFIKWALDALPTGYERKPAGRKMTEQEIWDEGPDDF